MDRCQVLRGEISVLQQSDQASCIVVCTSYGEECSVGDEFSNYYGC